MVHRSGSGVGRVGGGGDHAAGMTSRAALTVRTPDDLLACIPLVLGFVPQDSAVVLSLPPGSGPHARADVDASTDVDELADALVRPVLSHGVARVAVVVLAELGLGAGVARHLEGAFASAGVEVVAVLAADGQHWVSVSPATTRPREYDPLAHPFVTEAVVRGQVVLSSRTAVRDQLEPDAAWVADVGVADAELTGGEPADVPSPDWMRAVLAGHVAADSLPGAHEVACLLRGVADQDGRDASWAWVRREDARRHVEVWLRVVRGCPPEGRAEAAAVLAFHAWLVGDGALAWCAVEASRAADGGCSLTALVEDLLTRAAPPSLWAPLMEPPTDEEVERARAARP